MEEKKCKSINRALQRSHISALLNSNQGIEMGIHLKEIQFDSIELNASMTEFDDLAIAEIVKIRNINRLFGSPFHKKDRRKNTQPSVGTFKITGFFTIHGRTRNKNSCMRPSKNKRFNIIGCSLAYRGGEHVLDHKSNIMVYPIGTLEIA